MIGLKYFLINKEGGSIRYKLREFIRELNFAWQRAWKGYDDSFWWSIDYTFITLHKQLFKEWRANIHSRPCNMTSDEWEAILDSMIGYLDVMDNDLWDKHDETIIAKDKFFELFSEHFYNLWD